MNLRLFATSFLLMFLMMNERANCQCTWNQMLFDGYEYNTPCPDIIAGTTYTSVPQNWAVHSGNTALYMNFVNCVGGVGACAGDTIYFRNIQVCPGMPTRISAWFATTFSGAQCDIGLSIVDTFNIQLATSPSIVPAYAPTWTHYVSPVFYPITSNVSFVLVTNAAGSPGGNDLSMDDFMVEECYELPHLIDTTICSNQTVTLYPGNFYSYLWNDNSVDSTLIASTSQQTDTNLYFVTVTDSNSCVFRSDTAQVIFTNCGIGSIACTDSAFCEKQCIDFFDLSGVSATSWQWTFQGASPDTSSLQNPTGICYNNYGTFDVTLIVCNSTDCDTITMPGFIHEFQNPVDSIYFSNDTLWSLPFPSYQWYEVSSGLVPGATNQYFIASNAGSYYCVVSDTIGCIATSNILVATGNSELNANGFQIHLQPNPNNGSFKISLNNDLLNKNCMLQIFDASGRLIFSNPLNQYNLDFNLQFETGLYFIEIKNEQSLWREKFVVNK